MNLPRYYSSSFRVRTQSRTYIRIHTYTHISWPLHVYIQGVLLITKNTLINPSQPWCACARVHSIKIKPEAELFFRTDRPIGQRCSNKYPVRLLVRFENTYRYIRVLNVLFSPTPSTQMLCNMCIGSNPLSGQPVNNLLTIKTREKNNQVLSRPETCSFEQ